MTCRVGACSQKCSPETRGLRSEGGDGLSCFVFSLLPNLVRKVQVKSFSYLTQKSIPYQGLKSVILRLEKVHCHDIGSGVIKGKWKMLLLAIKFLYERNYKILSKVKTNNQEHIFIICDGQFCFCFCFYVFCFLQIHLYLFFTRLYLGGVQPHTDSVPSGPCRNLTRTMSLLPWAQAPQITFPLITGFVWFPSRSHCVVFGFV